MKIIGCDCHPGFQQIACVDTDTGEFTERRLAHREEAEGFYRELGAQGKSGRVGMEASGHARWFERLISELQFELWIGDAAEIRAKRVRKQKTDRQDAQLILRLLLEDRFPRVWVPSWENRDLRPKDCESSHGSPTRRSDVLDVAQGMGLRPDEQVQFARGTARTSRSCAAEHRVIDWVSRSPSRGSSK